VFFVFIQLAIKSHTSYAAGFAAIPWRPQP